MFVAKFLSVSLLCLPAVLADGAAIVSALGTIDASTASLNDTVVSWDGDLLGALPISTKSAALLKDIHDGTDTAKSSANLSALEAISVAGATQSLIKDVNLTLANIVEAKSKFDHLLLSPITLLNLKLEKDATDKFSAAVASKVPPELVSAAQALAKQIDEAFDKAISTYGG